MGGEGGNKRPNKEGGGGGAGGDSKRQKKQYIGGRGKGQFKERHFKGLKIAGFDRFRSGTSGVQGVMVSCDVRAEGMCQAETVLALTDEAQDMYPELFAKEEEEDKAAGNVDDIEKAIEQEKNNAQKERESVFAYIRTEVKGLIFVETKGAGMDPIAMVQGFIKKVSEAGSSKTRHAVRMQPVVATCYAGHDEICKTIKPVIDKYLSKDAPSLKYAIIFKRRSNTDMDRDEIIKKVADLVDKKHTVDLTTPDRCILIDILTNACLIGIADSYHKFKRFNINELTGQTQVHGKGKNKAFEGGRVVAKTRDDKEQGEEKDKEGDNNEKEEGKDEGGDDNEKEEGKDKGGDD